MNLQRYTIDYTKPYLLDTDVSLGVSGYYYDRVYNEWTEERIGGRISLGYQFSHDLSGRVSFRGEQITIFNVEDPNIPEMENVEGHPNDAYGFGIGFSHDTRDIAFLPTEGHLIQFNFEQVVGTFQYPHAELDLRRHFTLTQRADGSGRHVLTFSGRVGYTGPDTPVYDNYFAGGFSTIRGFALRGASPKSTMDPNIFVGGEAEVLASVEYMFPITADDMLRGVLFCDSGTVEPSFSNWTDNYRVSPGFGLASRCRPWARAHRPGRGLPDQRGPRRLGAELQLLHRNRKIMRNAECEMLNVRHRPHSAFSIQHSAFPFTVPARTRWSTRPRNYGARRSGPGVGAEVAPVEGRHRNAAGSGGMRPGHRLRMKERAGRRDEMVRLAVRPEQPLQRPRRGRGTGGDGGRHHDRLIQRIGRSRLGPVRRRASPPLRRFPQTRSGAYPPPPAADDPRSAAVT